MELVYLWVEKYKNIKEQGFNFSPRFECEFDGENLTITPTPEKAIENFFGENINVTAIVGRNGSGKSNILKALVSLVHNIREDENGKLFLVFQCEDKSYCIRKINIDSIKINGSDYTNSICEKNLLSTLYFNYSLDAYALSDLGEYVEPKRIDGKIYIAGINIDSNKEMLKFLENTHYNLDIIKDFFEPTKISLFFGIQLNDDKFRVIATQINDLNEIDELEIESFKEFIKLQIFNTLLFINNNISYHRKYNNLIKTFTFEARNFLNNLELINDLYIDNVINTLKDENEPRLIRVVNQCKFYQYLQKNNDIKFNQNCKIDDVDKKLLEYLLDDLQIYIDFHTENDLSLNSLSYGQQTLIRLIYKILYKLEENKLSNVTLIMDEVETGFHPDWQKKFLSLLLDVLKAYKKQNSLLKQINIVCASHSPFIISDLPKENIIFLDKVDEESKKNYSDLTKDLQNRNCINVSKHIKINPFGANIHTLLSDGFFMQDGLMGEFAKDKISQILFLLSGKIGPINIPQKQIKPIIEIIGEDFLREKLLKMYHKKYPKGDKERLEELKAEISEIEKRIGSDTH